ncbi:hypothetical protein ACFB49_16490 [Sphingomonas sp. DBB INV C78]|uniref:nucleotidyltransferase family protein n=1 Tax=Sphingomonas sp. DBB INV C78 TaxID=3349434 RepID=UPI0036D2E094
MIIGAIVLAAGRSTRMGSNKLTADLGGKPVVAHVVDAIAAAGLPVPIVVTGYDAPAVEAVLADREARFVHATDHASGLSRSLAAGVLATPAEWDGVIICLGDMPMIRAALLRKLADRAVSGAIVVPCRNGRRGNPVLWTRPYFEQLLILQGDVGGKALIEAAAASVIQVECEDEGALIDADTPAALAELRAKYSEMDIKR